MILSLPVVSLSLYAHSITPTPEFIQPTRHQKKNKKGIEISIAVVEAGGVSSGSIP